MANSTFLQLTNRVLAAFNEVQLTSSSFSGASGFYWVAQDAVNQAYFDLCTYEDTEWPFLWSTTTFNTIIGQTDYIRTDTFSSINWESFRIERFRPTFSSATMNLSTGIATFNTTGAHFLLTGDIVTITGATDTGYNVSGAITVTSSTQFTIQATATTSPASGSILIFSENVLQTKLQNKAWDQYITQKYWDTDQNTDPSGYGLPKFIVRKPDNNLYVGGPSDRPYTIYYEGYTLPNSLVNTTDTTLIPLNFEQVLIDKALHYCYMFRDNVQEAQLVQQRYESNAFKMRRILIPQETFCNFSD